MLLWIFRARFQTATARRFIRNGGVCLGFPRHRQPTLRVVLHLFDSARLITPPGLAADADGASEQR